MFKISRLYLKLYLYFVAVILSLYIISSIFFYFEEEAYYLSLSNVQEIFAIKNSTEKTLLSETNSEIKKLSKNYDYTITVYNSKGEYEGGIKKTGSNLKKSLIKEVVKKGSATYSSEDRICFILPMKKESNTYYLEVSFINEFSFKEVMKTFLEDLLITCLIISVLVYPISLYFSRPLEILTRKAIKFSRGDFSEASKETDIKSNDEIGQLNKAFSHMAKEITEMIESKKELISDISHELNSPLSKMQLAAEIIKDRIKSGEIPSEKTVEKLSKNIDEMLKLVKELLELSRMNKAYTIDKKETDFEEIINSTVQKLQIFMDEKKITLKINKENKTNKIYLDKEKIERLIQNLLSNAIDYSPEEGIIEITIKKEEKHLSFSIKDEGPGISKENKDKVFEPFFRPDKSRTRKTGGTGLGLAIAHKIVTLHKGKIWVKNPGEKGANIIFKILWS